MKCTKRQKTSAKTLLMIEICNFERWTFNSRSNLIMSNWITPSPKKTKRPRLSPEVIDIDTDELTPSTSEKNPSSSNSLNIPSGSGSQKTLSPSSYTAQKEPDSRLFCEYSYKCYRRNPRHLMEFQHPFLEKLYDAMVKRGNYTEIPEGDLLIEFNKSGAQKRVILEQIDSLKNCEFNPKAIVLADSPRKVSPPNANSISSILKTLSPQKVLLCDESPSSTSSQSGPLEKTQKVEKGTNSDWKYNLKVAQEKRRKQFLESQKKCDHPPSKETINCSAPKLQKEKPIWKMNMQEKWEASCPFNLFLTKVTSIPREVEGVFSASFIELFDPSMGEVKAVCHINFMIDPEWLMDQFIAAGLEGKPSRIIFDGDSKALHNEYTWLKVFGVKSPFPYGHHHTKMSLVQYTDESARFIIYTANLIESDWDNRTQGIWIGPKCPKLDVKPSQTEGDSSTKFKFDLIQYLQTYPVQATQAWIDVIKSVDCSAIKVYLVASAPVTAASGSTGFQWGLCKMEKILRSLDFETAPNWPLIIQCSSIGTLGKGPEDWMNGELATAFAGKDRVIQAPIHVVYPSHLNVKESFDGLHGGGCLPYSGSTHIKQHWLEKHLCQWKADRSGRSKAVPHIKSYCRISPDSSKIAWFHLTSANLSKAAWGKLNKKADRLAVMSYEVGVLFVPQQLIGENEFEVSKFPAHFDIPVVKYERSDKPWLMDTLQALLNSARK